MKKLITSGILGLSIFTTNVFAMNIKIIDTVSFPQGLFGKQMYVYCIDGVKYLGDVKDKEASSLTPLYDKKGHIKTCK